MKSLFLVITALFGVALTELGEARYSGGSGTFPYSNHTSGAYGMYLPKYEMLPWASLESRREAITAAIKNLRSMDILYVSQGVGLDRSTNVSDAWSYLDEVMENVVAIHSSLPRIVAGDAGYEDIILTAGEPIDVAVMQQLEASIVKPDAWTIYAQWGGEIRQALQQALQGLAKSGVLTSDRVESIMKKFDNEFDVEGTRTIAAWQGGSAPPSPGLELKEKLDMPILEAVEDRQYKPRWSK